MDGNSSKDEQQCVDMAFYILDNDATIRETADAFGVSKSTVHKKMTEKIYDYNSYLGNKVRKVLNRHLKEAPRRGGEALRLKRQKEREQSSEE